VLARNPTGCYAFLDLKAAYDVIDRDILWNQLSEYVGMDTQTIATFRELFDNNVSALIVKGTQGPDIINKIIKRYDVRRKRDMLFAYKVDHFYQPVETKLISTLKKN
jgi:hypothetical protein